MFWKRVGCEHERVVVGGLEYRCANSLDFYCYLLMFVVAIATTMKANILNLFICVYCSTFVSSIQLISTFFLLVI